MDIRIERIETAIVDHPLRAERIIVSHLGAHSQSRFVTVTVQDSDGRRGFGEAATTPLWSGETAETARAVIESLFVPALVGGSFGHPREALARVDAQIYGFPFAKGAVDTAVWDLWAKARGVRATELFGDRKPAASLATRASVGAYPVERTVELAQAFWDAGVRTLKFKTGLPGNVDAERLRAVRERLGDGPVFTIDYNGAFRDAGAAARSIESMLPYRLALIEQPTHRERLTTLAEVRRRVAGAAPVMADECVFTPDQLQEALAIDAFDALSIYPGKNGGFTHAVEMAKSAQRAGKWCAIGCNLETDLGQGAMLNLAAGLSAFPAEHAHDFQAALFYQRSSVAEPIGFDGGRVTVPDGAGFGVAPREAGGGPG
jgi:muconate cycloisomerase